MEVRLNDSEDELDKKSLAGLRASFNPIERATISQLKKLVKGQEEQIAVLEKAAGIKKHLSGVRTPKKIRARMPKGKRAKAFQLHLSDTHSSEIVSLASTNGRNDSTGIYSNRQRYHCLNLWRCGQ